MMVIATTLSSIWRRHRNAGRARGWNLARPPSISLPLRYGDPFGEGGEAGPDLWGEMENVLLGPYEFPLEWPWECLGIIVGSLYAAYSAQRRAVIWNSCGVFLLLLLMLLLVGVG